MARHNPLPFRQVEGKLRAVFFDDVVFGVGPKTFLSPAFLLCEPLHFLGVFVEHLAKDYGVAVEAPHAIIQGGKTYGLVAPKPTISSLKTLWSKWEDRFGTSRPTVPTVVFSDDVFELQQAVFVQPFVHGLCAALFVCSEADVHEGRRTSWTNDETRGGVSFRPCNTDEACSATTPRGSRRRSQKTVPRQRQYSVPCIVRGP